MTVMIWKVCYQKSFQKKGRVGKMKEEKGDIDYYRAYSKVNSKEKWADSYKLGESSLQGIDEICVGSYEVMWKYGPF